MDPAESAPRPFLVPDGVVDAWINPNIAGSTAGGSAYLLPGLGERLERGSTLDQLIEEMDAAGVSKGVPCSGSTAGGDRDWVVNARERCPDRFRACHVVDPRAGMAAVRLVEQLVRQEGYSLIRMLGLQTGLSSNDPAYYPVYARSTELGVPVGLNGLPRTSRAEQISRTRCRSTTSARSFPS